MTTSPEYLTDSYAQSATAKVIAVTNEGGIILDRSLFYATSGGQPGDSGLLSWGDHQLEIATTIKGEEGAFICLPAEPKALPSVGQDVMQTINWDRRYRHMRMHSALHLLSVVIPLPVTGGSIGADKSRLDFDMSEPPQDKDALTAALNNLVQGDFEITERWITEDELDANPGLVKTLTVQPPRGSGRIRLVRIGNDARQVDLQPCGGTHVRRTGEIGPVRISKIEKKGKQNRRVHIVFDNS